MSTPSGVLKANTVDWGRPPRPTDDRSALATLLRTPKSQLLCIFAVLLVVAAPFDGGLAVLPNVVIASLGACVVDVAYTYWESKRWIVPSSALLSGLIVAFILGPQEPWIVVLWVAGFSSVSKHVVANEREHIFNPAALALLVSVPLFSTGQSWWGALGDAPGPLTLLLIAGGVFIVDRLNKFPLVLAFLATYFVAFAAVSMFDAGAVAEMFRSPFVQSALFLAFFMLTDPPTSPNRFGDQVVIGVVAALVACASQLLGAGQVYLLLGVLAANVWLAVRRWLQRRPRQPSPRERRRARRAAMATRVVSVPVPVRVR